MARFHKPVLLKEIINYLKVIRGEKYIDATIGGGGHAQQILSLGGKILGIDCDPEAIKAAGRCLPTACPTSWRLVQGNFVHLKKIAEKNKYTGVAGILFDLGVSTYQLETPKRGFSFKLEGPLDMRMDPSLSVTAADLVNGLNKGELDELFSKLGQEHYSRRIAEAICRARRLKPIKASNELAEIIAKVRSKRGFIRLHPATRCFQALRIAVNDELNNLKNALPQALDLLKLGGRLVVISFHSGEDRIVKQFFRKKDEAGELRILTKKPVRPTQEEVGKNPRSRSAKLRAGEKIDEK
ncbi:MAG TPA: 16S rRNA (cytosine(1402)-N(4))-methyltransferase RsmH [Nevskiaceae bacterium]|nr:16S rRNA (cytosine(1402)-N(4))-methyltransferase RsmH [Nevskiaceae bacterium]